MTTCSLILMAVVLVTNSLGIEGKGCLLSSSRETRSTENDGNEHPLLDGRIVGGNKINITDAPYQISLHTSKYLCGGSIISSKWVLTAAHCTQCETAARLKVRIGSSEAAKGGERIRVAKIVQHHKFNSSNVDYDYSLLKLSKKIRFDDTKKAITLPDVNDEFLDGDTCFVSGWGRTQTSAESQDWLRQVEVPIFNQDECANKYKKYGGITERMICAGYIEGGKDSCQGDSGGPLVNESGVLVGIVSWGYGCARPDYPGVYSRVTYVRDWIRTNSGV